jgi:hypothetical protein
MLSHRKRGLTQPSGPEAAPLVDFASLPRCRERLSMGHIAGPSPPIGRDAKPISVNPKKGDML